MGGGALHFVEHGVSWVEHHEGDILTVAAVMALGPAGAMLTPQAAN